MSVDQKSIDESRASAKSNQALLFVCICILIACFTSFLIAVGSKMTGEDIALSIKLFWISIPILIANIALIRRKNSVTSFGILFFIVCAAGIMAGICGLCFFISAYDTQAATCELFTTIVVVIYYFTVR